MKKILAITFTILGFCLFGQTYLINSGGSYSTCSGTFYDSGGSGGQYTNNENYTITFCSSTPGQAIQLAFSALNIESGWDYLYFWDGPNTSSPYMGYITGNVGATTIAGSSGCITVQFTSDNSTTRVGWAATISCVLPFYTQPTTGIANENVGACLVTNCGPFNFYDNGGSGGNYSNNINQVYRVFCPSIAGNCMRVTFSSFNVEPGYDFLQVNNGPTQNSPTFTTAPASATNYAGITGLTGNLNGSAPFSYTSSDPSGCLTFRFYSDNITNRVGWAATLQCVPCAGGPTGTSNSDCSNATAICSNAPVSSIASGPGLVAEGCNGTSCPAGGENHSNWYHFIAQTTGTLNITLNPANPADDYDFVIYQGSSCSSLTPIRCSDSGGTGTTGAFGTTGAANTDLTEDVLGNGTVRYLDVVAGQSYYMVVDEWSPNGGGGYAMTFGGAASLDCIVLLPIELIQFDAIYQPDLDVVDLTWITNSEHNSDYIDVEKSIDGINFNKINKLNAAGESQQEIQYLTTDDRPSRGVNYYRLNMFDKDGKSRYSEIKAVNILDDAYDMLTVFPNPTTGITEVIFNSYNKEEVLLTVQSPNGSRVVNTYVNANNGGNHLNLDMSGQANGVYFVTVTTSNKVYKTKLVKN